MWATKPPVWSLTLRQIHVLSLKLQNPRPPTPPPPPRRRWRHSVSVFAPFMSVSSRNCHVGWPLSFDSYPGLSAVGLRGWSAKRHKLGKSRSPAILCNQTKRSNHPGAASSNKIHVTNSSVAQWFRGRAYRYLSFLVGTNFQVFARGILYRQPTGCPLCTSTKALMRRGGRILCPATLRCSSKKKGFCV